MWCGVVEDAKVATRYQRAVRLSAAGIHGPPVLSLNLRGPTSPSQDKLASRPMYEFDAMCMHVVVLSLSLEPVSKMQQHIANPTGMTKFIRQGSVSTCCRCIPLMAKTLLPPYYDVLYTRDRLAVGYSILDHPQEVLYQTPFLGMVHGIQEAPAISATIIEVCPGGFSCHI